MSTPEASAAFAWPLDHGARAPALAVHHKTSPAAIDEIAWRSLGGWRHHHAIGPTGWEDNAIVQDGVLRLSVEGRPRNVLLDIGFMG